MLVGTVPDRRDWGPAINLWGAALGERQQHQDTSSFPPRLRSNPVSYGDGTARMTGAFAKAAFGYTDLPETATEAPEM